MVFGLGGAISEKTGDLFGGDATSQNSRDFEGTDENALLHANFITDSHLLCGSATLSVDEELGFLAGGRRLIPGFEEAHRPSPQINADTFTPIRWFPFHGKDGRRLHCFSEESPAGFAISFQGPQAQRFSIGTRLQHCKHCRAGS